MTHFTTGELGTNMIHVAVLALTRLLQDESGQDLVEYALLAALIGFASVTGINGIAAKISSAMTDVYTAFGNVVTKALAH